MRRLAGRELTVEIVGSGRGDEIGAMAKAVQVFKDNMVQADRLATEQAAERATNEQRASRLTALVQTFEARVSDLIRHVSSSATELEGTANAMTATAGQTNQQAAGVASAAEQASVNVQTVASAAEQLHRPPRSAKSRVRWRSPRRSPARHSTMHAAPMAWCAP